jgi:hypothetical protein
MRVAALTTRAPAPQSPDLLGFSLSWELDYANVLTLLERGHVPLLATERTEEHPIVFGGGPVLTVRCLLSRAYPCVHAC